MKTYPQAYMNHQQERNRKLSAVGYPYFGHITGKNGAWNIPTIDESIYFDFAAGLITLHEAAVEWHRNGWTNFVDEQYAREQIKKVDEKYHRIDILSEADGLSKLTDLRNKLEAAGEDADPIEIHHMATEVIWLEQKYVEDLPF